jgi:hypothetical protein
MEGRPNNTGAGSMDKFRFWANGSLVKLKTVVSIGKLRVQDHNSRIQGMLRNVGHANLRWLSEPLIERLRRHRAVWVPSDEERMPLLLDPLIFFLFEFRFRAGNGIYTDDCPYPNFCRQ